MKHCLNKRNNYATQIHEQTQQPEELQERNPGKPEEPQNSTDEGRRPSIDRLTEKQKTYLLEEIFDFFEELIAHYEVQ